MGNLAEQPHPHPALAELDQLLQRYRLARAASEAICTPLQVEDYVIQSTPEVSPPKWHLAHVTWFFETFVLLPYLPGYRRLNEAYDYLFNSYYQTHGSPFPRTRRGVLSRPGVEEIYAYRRHVDQAMGELLVNPPREQAAEIVRRVGLGLQHEQQHQELLLMDIKHILAQNPMHPVYRDDLARPQPSSPERPRWHEFAGGVQHIGHAGSEFAFDCETPRHRQFVEDFQLAERLVSNGEYLSFIADGGYARPELWLSDGWDLIQQAGWNALLYWLREDGAWHEMTSAGCARWIWKRRSAMSAITRPTPMRWAGARLPSEAEGSGGSRPAAAWQLPGKRLPATGRRACRSPRPAAAVRRRLGVDRQRLPALPRLSPAGRQPRRIQRQVHVWTDGAARRPLRHAGIPRAGDLPQLLPAGDALAVRRLRLARGFEHGIGDTFSRSAAAAARGLAARRDPGRFAATPKWASPKFFYDRRGSELFEQICRQPEYYITRTEEQILAEAANDILDIAGPHSDLIELGSGASRKVRLLLEALHPTSYLGIDISEDFLLSSTQRLAADYPGWRCMLPAPISLMS